MGLESNPQWLADLNRLWPLGTDQKRYGDDNIRNLKLALQNSFGGFAAGVWVTGTDGGAVNAYTVTPAVLPPSLGAKMTVVFAPTITNTGACTLNYAGLGVKNLKSVSGADLVAGDLVAGCIYAAFYTGTEYRLLSITKNYADQLSFTSALPNQAGNGGKLLGTDGTASNWTDQIKASVMRWVDGTDTTKKVAFNVASVTTGTTRTITVPDRDIVVGMPYMKVHEQQSSGTQGGASLAADITQTRVLNTTASNSIAGASLASNQVTLPAGTYLVKARAPAYYAAGNHKLFLYNVTDTAYALIGSSAVTTSTGAVAYQTDSTIMGLITIAATKVFSLRHYTAGAQATNGLGVATNSGQLEIYAELEFIQVS